jgi:hypothetical protein
MVNKLFAFLKFITIYDLKLSQQLNAIKSSQMTSRVNTEQSSISETFLPPSSGNDVMGDTFVAAVHRLRADPCGV